METPTKQINDMFTDFVILTTAENTTNFMDRYLRSASNIQNEIQSRIDQYVRNAYSTKEYETAYKLPKQKVPHRSVADTLYLKGGICADFHALGINRIKPSDLDYSISATKDVWNYLTDESNLLSICQFISKELTWFEFPQDFEGFYELLNFENDLSVYNSYSDKTQFQSSENNVFNTDIRRSISFSKTILHGGNLVVLRFYWSSKMKTDSSQDLTCKVNIVDISIHKFVDKLSNPILDTYQFGNHSITTETPEAMLNDQMMVYSSGILRQDRKLNKRKTRVLNLISKITCKNTQIYLVNPKSTLQFCKDNIKYITYDILCSTEVYPYLVLGFLVNMNSPEINLTITPEQYMPQNATRDRSLSDYSDPNIVIVDKAKLFLRREQPELIRIMNQINNAISSIDYTKIYAGQLPTEEDITRFIRDGMWKKAIPVEHHHIWERLSKMSNVQLSIIIDDSHYNVYQEWKHQN
jgi:hypothetical protein